MDLWFTLVSDIVIAVIFFLIGWNVQKKETKKVEKRLEMSQRDLGFLRQHVNAVIRLGNDERGKIVVRPDGTLGIDRKEEVVDSLHIDDELS